MKKIGIISLYNNSYNYGGVLQAFALCKLVEQEGFEATQIRYARTKKMSGTVKGLKTKSISHILKRFLEKTESGICDALLNKTLFQQRKNAFDCFKKKFILESENVYSTTSIDDVVSEYDAFITGSDQVWNPNLVDRGYFLQFVPDEKIKISYAASVAAPIHESKYSLYCDALQRLDGISVRESNIQQLLEKISKKKVEWVLDPTLTLDRQVWEDMTEENIISDKYILCYFLGGDQRIRQLAKKYARKKNYKIVTLPFLGTVHKLRDRTFGDIQMYDVGPDRFLTLVRNAECIFTDSFHAVAFSHVFRRPFWAFHRKGFNKNENRVLSLLELSGLEERYLEESESKMMDKIIKTQNPDFEAADKNLQRKQYESKVFLHSYLRRIK